MESIIKESTNLYHEIDDCITNLIKARLNKDIDKENEAICCMESLLVSTMQNISWLVGELKGGSKIKWQTGEPKYTGEYLVCLKNGRITTSTFLVTDGCWGTTQGSWQRFNESYITYWCELSDIKPYKEE